MRKTFSLLLALMCIPLIYVDSALAAVCKLCLGNEKITISCPSHEKDLFCSKCGWSGSARTTGTCATCNGRGRINCSVCGGTGRVKGCSWCNNTGYILGYQQTCPVCEGSISSKCILSCSGTGRLKCHTCAGTGTNSYKRSKCPTCSTKLICNVCLDNKSWKYSCPLCQSKNYGLTVFDYSKIMSSPEEKIDYYFKVRGKITSIKKLADNVWRITLAGIENNKGYTFQTTYMLGRLGYKMTTGDTVTMYGSFDSYTTKKVPMFLTIYATVD